MPRYTQPRRTWKYSIQFKRKAVLLSIESCVSVKDVALGLDIHPYMLSRWRKEAREGEFGKVCQKKINVTNKNKLKPGKLTEVERLKHEVSRLKEENDLLKKWQRYLAEVHQNDLDSSRDTEK